MVVPKISLYLASPPPDGHGSSPSSHWIGDLSCGIIINHLTVHMYSIQAGLTSAMPLPLPLVMIAFAFLCSAFSKLTTSRQRPTMPSTFFQIGTVVSRQCYLLDKEVLQWTKETYDEPLSCEACLVHPLSGNPNNPALSFRTRHGIYISTTNSPPKHSLSSNNNSHSLPSQSN